MGDERFRLVWESAVDAMLLLDPQGIVVDANPSFFQLHGYGPEEIIGRSFAVIFSPETRDFVAERFVDLFHREEILPSYDFSIRRRDGVERIVEGRVNFVVEEGRRTLMFATLRDISERVQFEQAVRKSEEHFRLLIDNALDIITVIEGDGTIRYESPSVERVLGFRPEELVGRNAFEMIHPDDLPHVFEIYLPALNIPGASRSVEFRYLTASGDWIWLESIGTNLLEHPTLNAIVINSRDVTARRRAEQALQEANELLEARVAERTRELGRVVARLEQAHAMQKRFVADASHDLRTPLTVIRGELDLLAMEESLDPDVVGAIDRMKEEVVTLDQLTRDLLMLARLDTFGDRLERWIPLAEALRDEIRILEPLALEKGISWDLRLDESATIAGDAPTLGRAVRNVIENAIVYSDPGTTVCVRLENVGAVAGAEAGGEVVIAVENIGVGIPAKDLERVFDRFYRTDLTRSSRGTGLGLSIVRSVVAVHGGAVSITSTPGALTTVTIRLPVGEPAELAQ